MGSELIDQETQRRIARILYICAAFFALLIFGIWALLLLNLTSIVAWPQPISASTALVIFGISLAISCAVIWFLSQIMVITLSDSTERLISKLLIASILGTVATAIVKAFK